MFCNGVDINLCREDNISFFLIVCENGWDSILEFLLKSGVNVNLCLKSGFSFFCVVCNKGYEKIV